MTLCFAHFVDNRDATVGSISPLNVTRDDSVRPVSLQTYLCTAFLLRELRHDILWITFLPLIRAELPYAPHPV